MLYYGEATYGKQEIKAVNRVLKNGWLSGGKETVLFEKELADWWGMKYAISTNSGSSANFIALMSLKLRPGDEVITPACGFPTTVSPIIIQGFTPVYVDVHKGYTICIEEVEEAITLKTKAIMFSHTLGNVCDMDQLMKVARENSLYVIEDCCDAVGSKWDGKKVGTFGDLATVSFYPAHHMTTGGEGGAILTNDSKLYERCKSIRDWGRACICGWNSQGCNARFDNPPFDHKYYYTNLGMNLKLTEMQAAFGREQLKRLDGFIAQRKSNFEILYSELMKDPERRIRLPQWDKKADVSWFAFPYLCYHIPERNGMMRHLEKLGIQTRTLFSGDITKHPAYRGIGRIASDLTLTDLNMSGVFFVGVGPKLTKDNMKYIANGIKSYQRKKFVHANWGIKENVDK